MARRFGCVLRAGLYPLRRIRSAPGRSLRADVRPATRQHRVGVRLSPTGADAAAESIDEAALAMVHALAGEPEVLPMPIPFDHAEPHGVYADDQEPVSAEMAISIMQAAGPGRFQGHEVSAS